MLMLVMQASGNHPSGNSAQGCADLNDFGLAAFASGEPILLFRQHDSCRLTRKRSIRALPTSAMHDLVRIIDPGASDVTITGRFHWTNRVTAG